MATFNVCKMMSNKVTIAKTVTGHTNGWMDMLMR